MCAAGSAGRAVAGATAASAGCSECVAGTAAPLPGLPECNSCAVGQISGVGAMYCQVCPAGAYANSARTACVPCEPGNAGGGATHCAPCAQGRYASSPGQEFCPLCMDGRYCQVGSTQPDAAACMAGAFCTAGVGNFCPSGTFSTTVNATNSSVCTPCPPNTAQGGLGAVSCSPCTTGEGAPAGAAACWPVLRSITAVDPPPVVADVSDGDVLSFLFSSPTNRPPGSLAAVLLSDKSIGCNWTGAWDADGLTFRVTLEGSSASCFSRDDLNRYIGVLRGGWNASSVAVRDATGRSAPWPGSPSYLDMQVLVGGGWGVAVVPGFMGSPGERAGAWAYDEGHNAGLSVGDVLELRFNAPAAQVPLASKTDVDHVFAFSAPIADDYTGAWVQSGPYAYTVARITIRSAWLGGQGDAAWRASVAVGVLAITVLAKGNLTSLDGTTAASTSSVLVAGGSWGVAGELVVDVASATALRVRVTDGTMDPRVVGVRVEWAATAAFSLPNVMDVIVAAGTATCAITGLTAGVPAFVRARFAMRYVNGPEMLAELGPLFYSRLVSSGTPRPPVLSDVTLALTGAYGTLGTSGGEGVVIQGSAIGLAESSVTGFATNAVGRFPLVGCTAIEAGASVLVNCLSSPGIGSLLNVYICVDNTCSVGFKSALRYAAPSLATVEVQAGGAMLVGRDFGPSGVPDRVWMTYVADTTVVFDVPNCNVMGHTSLWCPLPLGAGAQLTWAVTIGQQNSSSPFTSYSPPSVYTIACDAGPCDALKSTGYQSVVIGGAAFGPARSVNGRNFVASPLGGVYFEWAGGGQSQLLACAVTLTQTAVECVTPPDGAPGGQLLSVKLVVLGVASARWTAASMSYAPAEILMIVDSVSHGPLPPAGSASLYVSGSNFGGSSVQVYVGPWTAGSANDLVPYGSPAFASSGHSSLVFNVPALPASIARGRQFKAAVRSVVSGAAFSNLFLADIALPSLSLREPMQLLDDTTGCGSNGRYLLSLSGASFGTDADVVSVLIAGQQALPCALCTASTLQDGKLQCATNATLGVLSIARGDALALAVGNYSAEVLLLPPSLESLSVANPSSLSPSGNDIMTLVGRRFRTGCSVFFTQSVSVTPEYDRSMACAIISALPSQIACATPSGIGSLWYAVLIFKTVFVARLPVPLSYAPPLLISVFPVGALVNGSDVAPLGRAVLPTVGTLVVVTGRNFGTVTAAVVFALGGVPCVGIAFLPILAGGPSRFTCQAPPGLAATVTAVVTVGGQTAMLLNQAVGYAAPVVLSVTPSVGTTAGGDVIILVGSGFGPVCPHVWFLLPAPLSMVSAAAVRACGEFEIAVVTPAGACDNDAQPCIALRVATASQSSESRPLFSYNPPRIIAVAALSAKRPTTGYRVRISGESFGAIAFPFVTVSGGGMCGGVSAVTDSVIECDLPSGSGAQIDITVNVLGRNVTAYGAVGYDPPRITGVVPPSFDARTWGSVLFWGENFAPDLAIAIGGLPCTPTFHNATAVSCSRARARGIGWTQATVTVAGQVSAGVQVLAECMEGYYGRAADVVCTACPQNAFCPGGALDPLPNAGFFRVGRTEFAVCTPPEACVAVSVALALKSGVHDIGVAGTNSSSTTLSGIAISNCAIGYGGPLCARCVGGFFRKSGTCAVCPTTGPIIILIFVVLGFMFAIAVSFVYKHRIKFKGACLRFVGEKRALTGPTRTGLTIGPRPRGGGGVGGVGRGGRGNMLGCRVQELTSFKYLPCSLVSISGKRLCNPMRRLY